MKRFGRRMVLALGLLLLTVTLQGAARGWQGFADWYGEWIYPVFVRTLGWLSNLVPISVVEILLYVLMAVLLGGFLITVVKTIIRLIRKETGGWYRPAANWGTAVLVLASALFLMYTLTCGIQYQRESFSEMTGFERKPAAEEELKETCLMLLQQINEAVPYIAYDENGSSLLIENAGTLAREAMEALGTQYPCMEGYYPKPKGVLVSEILSYQQLSGVYSPFTVEANYNADMPAREVLVTMCHELSHLRGFMREDEANFIAYLACINSEHPELRYSGAMLAFSHCMSAYYGAAGSEAYWEIYDQLDPKAIQDRRNGSAWWSRFEGPIAETATSVNDAYLKANSQSDGVKSYGRMTDLIIAYWRRQTVSVVN